jgi:hypothetical protein
MVFNFRISFLTKTNVRHFEGYCLNSLIKESRQLKQCEKRLFKVVTVNYTIIHTTTVIKSHFVVHALLDLGAAVSAIFNKS